MFRCGKDGLGRHVLPESEEVSRRPSVVPAKRRLVLVVRVARATTRVGPGEFRTALCQFLARLVEIKIPASVPAINDSPDFVKALIRAFLGNPVLALDQDRP